MSGRLLGARTKVTDPGQTNMKRISAGTVGCSERTYLGFLAFVS